MIGRTLSRYEILEEISRGGMGIVYRARDIKLDRDVALKVLPAELVEDEERKRRFLTEAKAAAQLRHRSIAVVYEIDDAEDATFIAMELIDGRMLADVLAQEKLPAARCLELAVEIVEGVAAAHEKGIVHRDVKPANIMVTNDGHVKLIDFGVAKLVEPPDSADSEVQTRIKGDTKLGQVLGTVSYMSPEQAQGQSVDPRTDLFTFGIVLYEMLTGELPFQGPSAAETMSAIINQPAPPLAPTVKGPLMPAVSRVVERCLEKDPDDRYQTAKDLLSELRRVKRDTDSGARVTAVSPRPQSRSYLPWALVAAVSLTMAIAVALYLFGPGLERPTGGGFPTNATFSQLTSQPGPELFPSLSPDGRSVVYEGGAAGNEDLYLLRVGGENPLNLTEDSSADDTEPSFSPDGESIAFRSERQGGGLFVMGATGESVRRLTEYGFNPSWSPDGKEIVFATERVVANPRSRGRGSQLWIVNLETEESRQLRVPDGVQPHWSPNGRRVAFWAQTQGQRDIWTIPVVGPAAGRRPVAVTNDRPLDWNPVWSPDGSYLYFVSDRGGAMNLWRVPIDERSGSPLGPPEPVTTGVSAASIHPTLSRDGRIAYVSEAVTANIVRAPLGPGARTLGEPVFVTEGSVATLSVDVSPDGAWLTYWRIGVQEDIFIVRPDGSGTRQLTRDEYNDRVPRWSPDGKKIAFYSNHSSTYQIWMINPDGSGLEQVTDDERSPIYPAWSPDGDRLAVSDMTTGSFIVPLGEAGADSPPLLPAIGEGEIFVSRTWSPDGKWIAGERHLQQDNRTAGIVIYSVESGQYERLTDFGRNPAWLNDSQTLLFDDVAREGKIFAIDRVSKQERVLLSALPDELYAPALSPDSRTL